MSRLSKTPSGLMAGVVLILSLLLSAQPSAAMEIDWCASDPVFTVDGTTFQLTAYWPSENAASVQGVTYVLKVAADAQVGYTIPAGETTNVTVIVERASSEPVIRATATVNTSESFPTKATLDSNRTLTTYGRSNNAMPVVVSAGR